MDKIERIMDGDVRTQLYYIGENLTLIIEAVKEMRETLNPTVLEKGSPPTSEMLLCIQHYMEYALDTVNGCKRRFDEH